MSTFWTKEEIARLKELYGQKTPVKKISEELDKSGKSIRNKAYSLGITRKFHYTKEEIEYIKANYFTKNLREIAEDLGRGDNWQNISRLGRKLGLTNRKERTRHRDVPEPKNPYRTVNGIKTRRKYDCEKERVKSISKSMKEWHRKNEHPRGMLGKTHSQEYRKKRSEIMKKEWSNPDSYFNSEEHREKASERMSKLMVERIKSGENIYSTARGGKREDLGFYVRSRWEANIARYLKFLTEKGEIYKWEYEPDTFWFENIKRGTRSYTPDFKVWETRDAEPEYWEVKGYMDQKSKTRLKRMEKYYPEVKIKLIQEKEYKAIGEWSRLIPFWE